MARRARSRRPARARRRAWGGWAALAVAGAAVAALPVYRAWWRSEEANPVREGLELLDEAACAACHRTGGGWRWRGDGDGPASVEAVRDAVLNGRPRAAGFPAAMPAYATRLGAAERRAVVTAVAALEGLIGVPEDPELAAGHDVAAQMGCFGCHGPLGAGGVPNPGSLPGEVPGWLGRSLRARGAEAGRVLRDGSRPVRLPLPGFSGPLLEMPAYGDRLDSTELELLLGYVEWLAERPPEVP